MKRSVREAQIINAAKKCFIYKGYKEAGMRDIAAEANVALGTLYSYFRNKEELFNAIDMPELADYRPEHERQKEYIYFSSINLFAEKGYSNISMQEIADACKISKNQLYKYFKTKESLFKEMCLANTIVSYTDNLAKRTTDVSLRAVLTETAQSYFLATQKPTQLVFLREITKNSEKFPELIEIFYNYNMVGPCVNLTNYILRYFKDHNIDFESRRFDDQIDNVEWLRRRVSVFFASLENYFITKYVIIGFDHKQPEDSIIQSTTDVFMGFLKSNNLL